MNYLAHFYLSGSNEDLLVGNFIADSIHGNKLESFRDGVREGIRMHREIDFFTDHHAVTSRSKDLLRPTYNHFSGVIVDIFYDHFLAKNWSKYSNEPLSSYSQRIYGIMEKYFEEFPEDAKRMFPYMKKNNWLVIYSEVEGIRKVLTGMSRRIKAESKLETATDALILYYDLFEQDFLEFFPEIILYTEKFRK
ncbi:acyl carrier protein phosphodiesterase [soil metagenome]